MPNRTDIVAAARSWIGTPWRHQGRGPQGIDCAGLVVVVGRDLGLTDYDDKTAYQRRTTGQDFLRPFKENMTRIPIGDAKPGDVLLFRDHAYPCHSALVGERGGRPTIIHAHALRRKVLEEPLEQGEWMALRVACFRFHGVEE